MGEQGAESGGNTVQRTAEAEFVEVMFAKSSDEASQCRTLLEDRGIAARVRFDGGNVRDSGVPVLVPADCLDDAAELLAMRVQDDDEEDGEDLTDVDSDDDDDDDDDDLDDGDDEDAEFIDDDEE